jgi:hypothetical protein
MIRRPAAMAQMMVYPTLFSPLGEARR